MMTVNDYFFLLPVLSARESVYFAAPFSSPTPSAGGARAESACGVDVRLLLPGPETDNFIVRASGQSRYRNCSRPASRYTSISQRSCTRNTGVDGKWSIVGSPNLNSRSRELDEENALGVYDEALGAKLQATFKKDIERSKAMNLEEWRRRNPLQKFFETVSRILDQQS